MTSKIRWRSSPAPDLAWGSSQPRRSPKLAPPSCWQTSTRARCARPLMTSRRPGTRQLASPATWRMKRRPPPWSSARLPPSVGWTWRSTTPACRFHRATRADETAENFDRVNAINLRGVWASMKHELRQMREQGSGAIVNCSSLGGLVGLPSRAAYHASKHGVIGLTKSAALEYAPRGVRINAVCPGTIDTPMVADMLHTQADAMKEIMRDQPIGRLGRSDEIAAAVHWLCRPGASFVIGVALRVDGGFTAH